MTATPISIESLPEGTISAAIEAIDVFEVSKGRRPQYLGIHREPDPGETILHSKTICSINGIELFASWSFNPGYVYAIDEGEYLLNAIKVAIAKGCKHQFKEYLGFTEHYFYCTICDKKKEKL